MPERYPHEDDAARGCVFAFVFIALITGLLLVVGALVWNVVR